MKPLDGIRVLDLTQYFSGPHATLLLAGLGAEVIRIDNPATGDPVASSPPYVGPQGVSLRQQTEADIGIAYLKRARGKKAITLNLKSEEGRDIFLRLAERADVLVENFTPGVTRRLGLDYETLSARFSRLIYCSITGYGPTGPDARRKAYDAITQAEAGLMSITGFPDGPPTKAGSALSDGVAGTYAVAGILAALYARERTGRGQLVDVTLVETLLSLVLDEPLDCYERLGMPFRQGNRLMRFSPFNTYATCDGWVVIGAATTEHWHNILCALDREDLSDDPRFHDTSSRLMHNEEVDGLISSWCAGQTTDDALRRLRTCDVICAPVRTIDDVKAWPLMRERCMLEPLSHPMLGALPDVVAAGFPIHLGATPGGYDSPAPLPGEHTEAILSELPGMNADALVRLREEGVV